MGIYDERFLVGPSGLDLDQITESLTAREIKDLCDEGERHTLRACGWSGLAGAMVVPTGIMAVQSILHSVNDQFTAAAADAAYAVTGTGVMLAAAFGIAAMKGAFERLGQKTRIMVENFKDRQERSCYGQLSSNPAPSAV